MDEKVCVIGIDLSGPRNVSDTAVVAFRQVGKELHFLQARQGMGDREIVDLVSNIGGEGAIVVGIDAPLSYNAGGGDRRSDKELRRLVLEHGGGVGVMPPTLIRMVYLTLRGVALSRMLEALSPPPMRRGCPVAAGGRPGRPPELRIVEVHPGAAMLLRGAPAADVRAFKREAKSRGRLLHWLDREGLKDLPSGEEVSDHFVAACAAGLAAWQWSKGSPAWCYPAQPPEHPYDFAC